MKNINGERTSGSTLSDWIDSVPPIEYFKIIFKSEN
ncbi:hypothetical protein BH10BAC5_BH10BAC5_19210 [soil metagenome]